MALNLINYDNDQYKPYNTVSKYVDTVLKKIPIWNFKKILRFNMCVLELVEIFCV